MVIAANLLVIGRVAWLQSEIDALILRNRESVTWVYKKLNDPFVERDARIYFSSRISHVWK